MLSSDSHEPHRILSLAAAVALLGCSAALAADQDHSFVLTVYSDGAGGRELMGGDYQRAEKTLRSSPGFSTFQTGTSTNNRCVVLAITGKWESARVACDEAVRAAQQERLTLPSYEYSSRKNENEYLAVALSNRAVLHWLSADSAAATNDLKKAESLSPKAAFVVRNRAALEYAHASVAQVAVAPVSP